MSRRVWPYMTSRDTDTGSGTGIQTMDVTDTGDGSYTFRLPPELIQLHSTETNLLVDSTTPFARVSLVSQFTNILHRELTTWHQMFIEVTQKQKDAGNNWRYQTDVPNRVRHFPEAYPPMSTLPLRNLLYHQLRTKRPHLDSATAASDDAAAATANEDTYAGTGAAFESLSLTQLLTQCDMKWDDIQPFRYRWVDDSSITLLTEEGWLCTQLYAMSRRISSGATLSKESLEYELIGHLPSRASFPSLDACQLALLDSNELFKDWATEPKLQLNQSMSEMDLMDLLIAASRQEDLIERKNLMPRVWRYLCRTMHLRPSHVHNMIVFFYDIPPEGSLGSSLIAESKKIDMHLLIEVSANQLDATLFFAKWLSLAIVHAIIVRHQPELDANGDPFGSTSSQPSAMSSPSPSPSPSPSVSVSANNLVTLADRHLALIFHRIQSYFAHQSQPNEMTTLTTYQDEISTALVDGGWDQNDRHDIDTITAFSRWWQKFAFYLFLTHLCNIGALEIHSWITIGLHLREIGYYKTSIHYVTALKNRYVWQRLASSLLPLLVLGVMIIWFMVEPVNFFFEVYSSPGGLASLDGLVSSSFVYIMPLLIYELSCLCASFGMAQPPRPDKLELKHRIPVHLVQNNREESVADNLGDMIEEIHLAQQRPKYRPQRDPEQPSRVKTIVQSVIALISVAIFCLGFGSFVWFIVFYAQKYINQNQLPELWLPGNCSMAEQQRLANYNNHHCILYHCVNDTKPYNYSNGTLTHDHDQSYMSCNLTHFDLDRLGILLALFVGIFLTETSVIFPYAVFSYTRCPKKRLDEFTSLLQYKRKGFYLPLERVVNINAWPLACKYLQADMRQVEELIPLLVFCAILTMGTTLLCVILLLTKQVDVLFFTTLPFAVIGGFTVLFVLVRITQLNLGLEELADPLRRHADRLEQELSQQARAIQVNHIMTTAENQPTRATAEAKTYHTANGTIMPEDSKPTSTNIELQPLLERNRRPLLTSSWSDPSSLRTMWDCYTNGEYRLFRLRSSLRYFHDHLSGIAIFGFVINKNIVQLAIANLGAALFAGIGQLVASLNDKQ